MLEELSGALRLIGTLDHEVLQITLLSLEVSVSAVLLSAIISLPLAYLLATKRFRGRQVMISIIHTGMALPPVVAGLFIYLLLSRDGPLGYLEIIFTPGAMIMAQMVLVIPYTTGIAISAFSSLEKRIKETAITLGATPLQYAFQLFKESRYGITTAMIGGLGRALSEVGAIIIVGGNIRYHTRALTTSIVLETRRGNFEMAMALGIILLALALLINIMITHVQQRRVER